MRIERLDHLVLTVASVEATVDFYTRVLGMEVVTFGAGRRALAFGRQKINLNNGARRSTRKPGTRPPAPAICASSAQSRWTKSSAISPGQAPRWRKDPWSGRGQKDRSAPSISATRTAI